MFSTDIVFGPLFVTFLIGLPTILLLYWYSKRNHGYWKEKGIPCAESVPVFGSLFKAFFTPLHEIELNRYRNLGKIYGHFEGNRALISVADTALLRQILVKDFYAFADRRTFKRGDPIVDNLVSNITGEDWKRIRTIITPTFTTGKIKRMIGIFKDCSETAVQNFELAYKSGKRFDAKRIYGAFTMDVIASAAFSTKLDSHNDPDNKFVREVRKAINLSFNWRFILFLFAPWVMRFFKIGILPPSVQSFFKNLILQIMEQRKQSGNTRNDFLQLLMDTADDLIDDQMSGAFEKDIADITDNYGEDGSSLNTYKLTSKKSMSKNEIVAQCLLFFLAGYDTTASTLTFASYLLAINPDKQEKLRQEVDELLKEYNGEITYEAIQRMKYLDNVISETLRIYPPAIRLERMATADYQLGDTGITVPKNMIVTIPSCAIHKDPELWDNSEEFHPERFDSAEREKRDPYAYLPFGAGPRNCVGMRFALMEIKVCLANIVANFKLKKNKHTKVPLEFYLGQGLLQAKEVAIDFEKINGVQKVK